MQAYITRSHHEWFPQSAGLVRPNYELRKHVLESA
jgi:hypothetical protein